VDESRRGEVMALGGQIARYARGPDYHRVMLDKLRTLADACATAAGRPILARPCVDSAPLLERAVAVEAGVGFVGRNTMTIVPGHGSRVVLGELLLDLALDPDPPLQRDCEECSSCVVACPTGALVGPHRLVARRCISYLTIEFVGVIPRELRAPIGTRVFGCDACQDVCPYNDGRSEDGDPGPELPAHGWTTQPDLSALLELGSSAHRRLVRGTCLGRVSRNRLARNAAVALGNTGDVRAVAPLARALADHTSSLVRAHAAWALGRIGGEAAITALGRVLRDGDDDLVLGEAREALAQARGKP
jgi:epoxyqueuosine reductase